MEFLKPYIAKRGLKELIERQLGDELIKALNELNGVTRTFACKYSLLAMVRIQGLLWHLGVTVRRFWEHLCF
jgi:hypothetical protein